MAADTHNTRDRSTTGFQVSRRDVLRYFAALVACGGLGKEWLRPAEAAAPSLSLDDFLTMATGLCGIDASDPDDGKPFWEHFGANADLPSLIQLAAIVKANPGDTMDEAIAVARLDHLANTVVAAFYSGEIVGPHGTQLVTYLDALVWQAVESFTKPPGICGGSFGYWADPPQQSLPR